MTIGPYTIIRTSELERERFSITEMKIEREFTIEDCSRKILAQATEHAVQLAAAYLSAEQRIAALRPKRDAKGRWVARS